ncbi:MAG: TraB/GumN family protein [Phenylobacterium sp.]|uniref:TraB/GumN family protein n=1 Tax=Phenylobacterium sp. TaxID=1871053 RepID=UPI001A37DBEB|nr:TraB/GumN family protein [Phenylobacterium sp.]MBL8769772.1 TraB/GumN family protein [Phenylobacterium sp.]
MKAVAAALAAALAVAAPAAARPPIWTVKDADSELVIFGSIHVLPPGLDWRPPALDAALARADDVWFELPVDAATQQESARVAAESGVLPLGQSLFRQLPPADARRLMKVAAAYGVDPLTLDRLEPWFAEVALAAAAYRKAGATSDSGVEAAVGAAVPTGARRRALETPAQQIALLDGAHAADQLASLRWTLKAMERDPQAFAALVRAWMAGDVRALDARALQPLRRTSPGLFRRLVADRNADWARQLDARLRGSGRTVVVVGVGHLVGPEGVPARLRALGYSVTGP